MNRTRSNVPAPRANTSQNRGARMARTLGLAAVLAAAVGGCALHRLDGPTDRYRGVAPPGSLSSQGGSRSFGFLPSHVIDLRDLHSVSNTPTNVLTLPSGVILLIPADLVAEDLEILPDGRITAGSLTLTASGQLGAQIQSLNTMVESLAEAQQAGDVARANALTEAVRAVVAGLRDLLGKAGA